MSLQIQLITEVAKLNTAVSSVHMINMNIYIQKCDLLVLRSIIAKLGNQTDLKVCVVITDPHIPQTGGGNFSKYIAPSFGLHGYCHISRTLGSTDHTL